MLLTKKLLAFINRVFDKDPQRFLALRIGYDGGLTWRVENAVLSTTVTGGVGHDLTVDLSAHTLATLSNYLAGQPGYSVLHIADPDLAQLSARVLLDGSNDIAESNGDHLHGYTNVLWAYLEAAANELVQAKAAIVEMLKQMSTTTASDIWLDELGGYYGIPRLSGENDSQYGPRIIAEVLRPRQNNVAIEEAIRAFTGQRAKVTDVVEWTPAFPIHNGAITHDSSETYNSESDPRYGLFDVEYGYDLLNGGDFSAFQQVVRDLIGRLRAAGTHLRALALTGSELEDNLTPPTDGGALPISLTSELEDAATEPSESTVIGVEMSTLQDSPDFEVTDAAELSVQYNLTHNSLRTYNGAVEHRGADLVVEAL